MDLRSQLAVLRARLWLIVVGVVVATAAALAVSQYLPKVYEAQTTLLVGQSLSAANPDYNQLQVSQQLTATYLQLATSQAVLQEAASKLKLSVTPDQLEKKVTAEQPPQTSLITITAQDPTAGGAAALANAVAAALIAQSPTLQGQDAQINEFVSQDLRDTQQQILNTQAEITGLLALPSPTVAQSQQLQNDQNQLVALRSSYATLLAASNASAANILSVVDHATPPTGPASPLVLVNAALGAALGLLLALALVFLLDSLDDTVRSVEEVRWLTGARTLGAVSRIPGRPRRNIAKRLTTILAPSSPASEAFRSARTNLAFAPNDRPVHTILVTSSAAGEGKTVVAANLAIAFAQAERATILVDADLRKPDMHRAFQLPDGLGLSDALARTDLPLERVLRPTEQPNLRVVPSGSLRPNPSELLASQRMRAIVDEVRRAADVVIVDSPPLRAVTDAAVLAGLVDGVVLVVDLGHTSRSAVRAGRQALAAVGATVLGTVVNHVSGADHYRGHYAESAVPLRGDEPRPERPAPATRADA